MGTVLRRKADKKQEVVRDVFMRSFIGFLMFRR